MTADEIVDEWSHLEAGRAAETILPCNGSRAWAEGVVRMRPFATAEELFAASDSVWRSLPEGDWQQAFDSHPRQGCHLPELALERGRAERGES